MTDFHRSLDAALAHQLPASGRAPSDLNAGPDVRRALGKGAESEGAPTSSPGSVGAPIFEPLTPRGWLTLAGFYLLPLGLAAWWVAGLART